jgi:hypothetical protein
MRTAIEEVVYGKHNVSEVAAAFSRLPDQFSAYLSQVFEGEWAEREVGVRAYLRLQTYVYVSDSDS